MHPVTHFLLRNLHAPQGPPPPPPPLPPPPPPPPPPPLGPILPLISPDPLLLFAASCCIFRLIPTREGSIAFLERRSRMARRKESEEIRFIEREERVLKWCDGERGVCLIGKGSCWSYCLMLVCFLVPPVLLLSLKPRQAAKPIPNLSLSLSTFSSLREARTQQKPQHYKSSLLLTRSLLLLVTVEQRSSLSSQLSLRLLPPLRYT